MTANRQRKSAESASTEEAPATKAPAKKASARKAPAKKAPAKKALAAKGTARGSDARSSASKTSAAKKSGDKTSATSTVTSISGRTRASAPRAESRPRASAMDVAGTAARQLASLTGKAVEGVTGIESDDDGWRVTVEILELRRIPDSTDVLALYEVDADENGNLMGYRRLRRYSRGSAGED